jgi:signal transduction histidine kinase
MTALAATRRRGWPWALAVVLVAQGLFWGAYGLILHALHPAQMLQDDRLPAAFAQLDAQRGPVASYAPGLSGAALLRLPGWQPVILRPAQASLLSRNEAGGLDAPWSLTCLESSCGETARVYAGPLDRMSQAARWERFGRFEMVWLAIVVMGTIGAALLVLLPISRFSRLQTITGLFMMLVSADAWLTTFGASNLPYAWFPLLRYGVEYLMLAGVAVTVNAFSGWRLHEARVAGACFTVIFAILVGALIFRGDFSAITPWLDAVALGLLFGYGLIALLRMGRAAPGPAIRVLAILLVGLASIAFDLFIRPSSSAFALQASVLAPPLTTFGILFEMALQGRRLNQEADDARSDLERQLLEQDASLLRSSGLLRHQERLLAIDAERQRLLRDMHDGIGGVLTHLLLNVRGNRLTPLDIEVDLQSAVDDLRNMASAFDAGSEPIDEALALFAERMRPRLARSGAAFDYRCNLPHPAPSLDVRRLLSLYRLLQEGIANSLRHAAATRIELRVEPDGGGAIRITLADDGTGFDPARISASPGEGRGLGNMRRRAQQIGAGMDIESAPSQGTRLTITFPGPP